MLNIPNNTSAYQIRIICSGARDNNCNHIVQYNVEYYEGYDKPETKLRTSWMPPFEIMSWYSSVGEVNVVYQTKLSGAGDNVNFGQSSLSMPIIRLIAFGTLYRSFLFVMRKQVVIEYVQFWWVFGHLWGNATNRNSIKWQFIGHNTNNVDAVIHIFELSFLSNEQKTAQGRINNYQIHDLHRSLHNKILPIFFLQAANPTVFMLFLYELYAHIHIAIL